MFVEKNAKIIIISMFQMSKLRDPDEIIYKLVHTDHLRSPWHTPGRWRRQHKLDIAGHFEFYSVTY